MVAEVIRSPIEAPPAPETASCGSRTFEGPAPRSIEFDEDPRWRTPFTPTFDPFRQFTSNTLTSQQFSDQLVSRSAGQEAVVDAMFELLCHCALEDAKIDLPDHAKLLEQPGFKAKLLSDVRGAKRNEFSRVRYLPHLYRFYLSVGTMLATIIRIEAFKKARQSSSHKRSAVSATTACLDNAATDSSTLKESPVQRGAQPSLADHPLPGSPVVPGRSSETTVSLP